MHPVALQIGSFSIRWYGVMVAIGFLLGTWLLQRNRKYAKMSADQASNIMFIGIVLGLIGARIFYFVQFYREQFRGEWWRIIRIDQGGLVFYGGFLLATAGIIWYAKHCKLDLVRVLDVCTPAITLGHACGRIGCFLNGCCYGRPTTWFWGVVYPAGSSPVYHCGAVPLHPVQLVEAAENILLCLLFCRMLKRVPRGVVVSTYFLVYGVLRYLNELMRGDNVLFFRYFTPAQLVGLGLIPAGALLLWYFASHARKDA